MDKNKLDQFGAKDNKGSVQTQNAINEKIAGTLGILAKNFTKKSDPVFLDENGKKLTLRQIFGKECISEKPVTMIAVTRHQYGIANFQKYVDYVKNTLEKKSVYYGLWPDGEKVEYDVLYVIPTDDYDQIQKNLNAHNHMNDGFTQKMGLIIFHDGTWKIVENV
jgi:hypothetical protein